MLILLREAESDMLHLYVTAEGRNGSEHQWQQSSQGGGDACAQCLHHQEDLPPAHYAAAVGHFACLQVHSLLSESTKSSC